MAIISIFSATVYGAADLTAKAVADALRRAGHTVHHYPNPAYDDFHREAGAKLVITSTTGQGELPDAFMPFYLELRDKLPLLNGAAFGVISLGDSSYGDTFCGSGALAEELMFELAGREIKPRLNIDAMETTEPEQEAVPWALDWAKLLD